MVSAAAGLVVGFLKSKNQPYDAAGVESYIKSKGTVVGPQIISAINGGHILNFDILAQNLNTDHELEQPSTDNKEVEQRNLCSDAAVPLLRDL